MLYVGLDAHTRIWRVCVLNGDGKVIQERTIRGSMQLLIEELAKLPEVFAICYEASCGYGKLYDQLKNIGARVEVAHPGQLRLIFRSKQKNDRVDARKLAQILFLDQVPRIHVPREQVRAWRRCAGYRNALVERRTRAKNTLRALLRTHGIESPRSLWSRKGVAWLREVEFPIPSDALQRDMLLDEIEQFDRQIGRVAQALDQRAKEHPGIRLLRTIPGVGPRTSEAVMAHIDDPSRFRRNRRIGSYFGMVPSQDSSAGVNRLGHITRQGPSLVRKLLVEAAWRGIRQCPHLAAYFERIHQGKPDRRKIALVATAHHMLRVMLAILQTGKPWNPPITKEVKLAS